MDSVKGPVRRWFDSGSYKEDLGRAQEHGNTGQSRREFFRSLISEIFTPECVMHFPDGDGGISRILEGHLAMLTAFPDLTSEIDDLIAEGDTVAVRGRIRGTNTGAFRGMPPTGNPACIHFIAICRVSNGRIAEGWGCNDLFRPPGQPGVHVSVGEPARPGLAGSEGSSSQRKGWKP